MTLDLPMSSATFLALKDELGDEGILDLVIFISLHNAVVRTLKTLDVHVDPEYAQHLVDFPIE